MFVPLVSGSHVPYNGMTMKWTGESTFENEEYPDANTEDDIEFIFSYTEVDDGLFRQKNLEESTENVLDRDTREFVEGDSKGTYTSHWIPHDIGVGDDVMINNASYTVSSLSTPIVLNDFGRVTAVELKIVKDSEDYTTESGLRNVDNHLEGKIYYDHESRILLKRQSEATWTTESSTLGDMHKSQTRRYQIRENHIDTDEDGLTDLKELLRHRTDPTVKDTDGDGLDDDKEIDEDTDPTTADTDGDGLTDGEEIDLGSDPLKTDTDGDGLSDGEEIDFGSDPLKADTDEDGLNDKEEKGQGTSATTADTDGDGISDGKEAEMGIDPTVTDTDGDMLSDSSDPFPQSIFLPNGVAILALLVLGGVLYWRRD